MQFQATEIEGVMIISPELRQDDRGYFTRAYCQKEFAAAGLAYQFVQSNLALSHHAGAVRGLHFQTGADAEAKLIRCVKGAIYDVSVDINPASPSYLKWVGVELSESNGKACLIPPHCAHGYQVLKDDSVVYYDVSAYYAPASEGGLHYADPALNIDWPLPASDVSEKDLAWPLITER